jgi:ubiquinone/menaquinone biosynthesis C-methylase UbiE
MKTTGRAESSCMQYADFRVGLPVRVKQALALLERHRIEAVLDIGCADTAFLSQFPVSCTKVGVDVAPNRFRPAGIRFVQADVDSQDLPFADECFDAVYAGEIIEHVLDTERFLREISRVLRAAGVLVLTTPNLCSLKNLYYLLRGRQLAWVDYKSGQYGHVRYFSPESVQLLLHETGFNITRMCSSGLEIGAHARWLAWVTPITQWVFAHSFRGNCLIVAAIKRTS